MSTLGKRLGAAIVVGLCAGLAAAPAALAQKRGGDVVVAMGGGPDTLDPHFSRTQAARNVTMHIFEPLITRGENMDVVPMLAESFSASDDNTTFTFRLRRDVKFHNGKTMTADDVVASLERYRRASVNKGQLNVASIEKTDDATIVIKTPRPAPIFLEIFSDYGTPYGIIPAEQANQEMGRLQPIVGTGPYRFAEWVPDSHVKLQRFEDYKPVGDKRDGFGGRKEPFFETVTFRIIKEDGARAAALETGEVHVVEAIPTQAAQRLAKERGDRIKVYDYERFWIQMAFVNMVNPPTDNLTFRKAIQAALDLEEIMDVATDGSFELDVGWQYPGTPYYTDAGKQFYNMKNPELAKKLLKESGYKGEPLILMTNTNYQDMYKASLVMEQQLKAIGVNVQLVVQDWATGLQIRNKDKQAWHVFMGAMGAQTPLGPALAVSQFTGPSRTQFLMDPKWDELYARLQTEPTQEKRLEAWKDAQTYMYDQVMQLKFGNTTTKQAALSRVKGFQPYRVPRMWGVWFE
jgi:peptide/nickel transport system substrate-binding protein